MTIEQIEQAATGRLPHTEEIAAQDRYALGKNVGYKRGFISGAKWRINSVWHDVANIPKKGEHIVVVFRSGNFSSWNVSYNIVDVFKKFDVILWSYSKDLLPERKEETNGGR